MAQPIRNKLKAFGYLQSPSTSQSQPQSQAPKQVAQHLQLVFDRQNVLNVRHAHRKKIYSPANSTNKHHYICWLFRVWFRFCSGSFGHLVNLQSACKACSVRGVCAMYLNISAQMWNVCMCTVHCTLFCPFSFFSFCCIFKHFCTHLACVSVCVCVSV